MRVANWTVACVFAFLAGVLPAEETVCAGGACTCAATTLRAKIAAKHRILGQDMWYGFRRTKFDFNGRTGWVVEPRGTVAAGRPWTWTMQWAEAYVDRTGVPALLAKGWHHVTLEAYDTKACDAALPEFAAFQKFLVDDLGLAPKACLVGMSWGGFYSVRYAAHYPGNVRRIYLDAPLLNLGGRGDITEARVGPWAKLGLSDAAFHADPRMPVNMAPALAKAGIPILLLYGGQDLTVPPKTNCELFTQRFKACGGKIDVVYRDLFGHHPHGLDPDKTEKIRSFFEAE